MNGEVLPLQLEEAEARNPAALQLIEQRRATHPPRQALVPKGGVMLRDGRGWHRVRLSAPRLLLPRLAVDGYLYTLAG